MKMTKLKPKTSGIDTFRKNLLAKMEELSIGPSDLSRIAKVDRSGVSRFLNGHQEPTLGWCLVVADALETSLSQLLEE